MIIAVDAVGGDFYPKNPVEGALLALAENHSLNIILVGPEQLIQKELKLHVYDSNRISIVDAPDIVTMKDPASAALKNKRNSSISIGLNAHKNNQCQGFVSAGNTGALLAASTLILGKLDGVIPYNCIILSTLKGFRLLVDVEQILKLNLTWHSNLQKWHKYLLSI